MNKFIKHDRSYTIDVPQESIGPFNISSITYNHQNDENDCSYLNKLNTTFTQQQKPQQLYNSGINNNNNNSSFFNNNNSILNQSNCQSNQKQQSQLMSQASQLQLQQQQQTSSSAIQKVFTKTINSTQEQIGHLTALQKHLEAEQRGEQTKLSTQSELLQQKQLIKEQKQKKREKELQDLHKQLQMEEEKQNLERQVVFCDPFQRKDRINQIFANQNKLDQSMQKMRTLLTKFVPPGQQESILAQEIQPLEESLRAVLVEKADTIHSVFEEQDRINILRERMAMSRQEMQTKQLENSELLCKYEDLEGIIEEIKLQYPRESQHICEEIQIHKNIAKTKEAIVAMQGNVEGKQRECEECKNAVDFFSSCIEKSREKLNSLRTIKANSRAEAEGGCEEQKKIDLMISEMIEESGVQYWRDICFIFSLGEGVLEASNDKHQDLFRIIAQIQSLILEELELLCSYKQTANQNNNNNNCAGGGTQLQQQSQISNFDRKKRLTEINAKKKTAIFENKEIIFSIGGQLTAASKQYQQAISNNEGKGDNKDVEIIVTAVLTCDQLFLNVLNSIKDIQMRENVEQKIINYLKQKLERFEENVSCSKAIFDATEEYKAIFNQMICKESVKCQIERQLIEYQLELEQLSKNLKQLEQKKKEKSQEYKVIVATLCEEFYQCHINENQLQLKDIKFKYGKAYVEKMEQDIRNEFYEANKSQIAQAKQRLQELFQQQDILDNVRNKNIKYIDNVLKVQNEQCNQEIYKIQENIRSLNAKLMKIVENERELKNQIQAVYNNSIANSSRKSDILFLQQQRQQQNLKDENGELLYNNLINMKIWQGEEIVHNYDNILTPQAMKNLLSQKIQQLESEMTDLDAKDQQEIVKIEKTIVKQKKIVEDLSQKLNKINLALKDINNNINLNSDFIFKNFNLDFKQQNSGKQSQFSIQNQQSQSKQQQQQNLLCIPQQRAENCRPMQDITGFANNAMQNSQISNYSQNSGANNQNYSNKNSQITIQQSAQSIQASHRPSKSHVPVSFNSNAKYGKITINFSNTSNEQNEDQQLLQNLSNCSNIKNSQQQQLQQQQQSSQIENNQNINTGSISTINTTNITNVTSPSISATVSNRYNSSNNENNRDSEYSGSISRENRENNNNNSKPQSTINTAMTVNINNLLQPTQLTNQNQMHAQSQQQQQKKQQQRFLKRTASEVSQLKHLDLSQIQFCQPISPNKTPSGLISGNSSRSQSPYTTNRKNSVSKLQNCSFTNNNIINLNINNNQSGYHSNNPKSTSECRGDHNHSISKQITFDSQHKDQQSCFMEKMSQGLNIYKMFSTNQGNFIMRQAFDPLCSQFRPEKCGYGKRVLKYNAKHNTIEIIKENEQGKKIIEFSSEKHKIIHLNLPQSTINIMKGKTNINSTKQKQNNSNMSSNVQYLPFGIDVENIGRIECLSNGVSELRLIVDFFKIYLLNKNN